MNGCGDEYVRLVENVGKVNGARVVVVYIGFCASVEGANVVELIWLNEGIDVDSGFDVTSGEYLSVVPIRRIK